VAAQTTKEAPPVIKVDRTPPLEDAVVREQLIELVGVERSHRMGRVDYRALRGIDLVI